LNHRLSWANDSSRVPATDVMPEGKDPLIGLTFYDYRVEKKLAQGGMGAVYLLRHKLLPDIRKVLKVILPEYASHPMIRERFEREAQAVSQLKHPYIAKIDSVSTIMGQPCMLIPFLEGTPLDEFIRARGGRLAPHRVMRIAAQIAYALHYAHALGIIHRDLKPSNVFVEPTDSDPYAIQVLDFGIAKQLNADAVRSFGTQNGPLGTPSYMAVEQYEHAADVTPTADVWALATMIWEMVTGHLPWMVQDTRVLYHKQLHEPPDPPVADMLSAEWEAILRLALSPDPRRRPQSMRELMQALASTLPAIPPYVPSGAEILRAVAPKFLDETPPDAETVRNQSNRPAVPAWPPRETPVPASSDSAVNVAAHAPLPPVHRATAVPPSTPQDGHGSPGRPTPATTLGSSAGVIVSTPRVSGRWKIAVVGIAAAILSGVGVFALAGDRDRDSSGNRSDAPARPAAAQRVPATSPSMTSQPQPTAFPAGGLTPAMVPPAEATTVTSSASPSSQPDATSGAIERLAVPSTGTPPLPAPTSPPTDEQPAATARQSPSGGVHAPSTTSKRIPARPGAATTPRTSNIRTGDSQTPSRNTPQASERTDTTRSTARPFDPDAVGGQESKP
jgi:eukaryotic-like serine/threonine-protein kinase